MPSLKSFEVTLSAHVNKESIPIDEEKKICFCQVGACSPEDALKPAFTLTPNDRFVNVQFHMDALAELNIYSLTSHEFSDFFDREFTIVGGSDSITLNVDSAKKTISIVNNDAWSVCRIQVAVKKGEQKLLKSSDRILDSDNKILIEFFDDYKNEIFIDDNEWQ